MADTEEERFDRTEVEARFVAHRIRQLLDEGFPVQGEDGQQRPVQPEDIVILMRSPAARRKAFTAALQREDIPCAGGEEQSFFETMEIAVMVSFLQIVDNPRQDVPLLAVLRSPLLGFSPDRLAQIRGGHPGGDYYGALCADDGEDSRAFLERLAQLRAAAGELTADRLLWKLYTDWQALAVFGAMEGGAQRRSNLLALYAYAGQLAAAGRGNLFDFVSYLHDLMESGDLPDISARQESGGVQLMTIHKSKGLEFPVVILADLQKGFNRDDFQRPVLVHPRLGLGTERVDRRRRIRYDTVSKQAIQLALSRESLAEEMRILYVAMTRAKEKLTLTNTRQRTLYGRTSPAMPSRFLKEIPEENMEWLGKPEPQQAASHWEGEWQRPTAASQVRTRREEPVRSTTAPSAPSVRARSAAPSAPLMQLRAGDSVRHNAFGDGMVLSVRPMGGDALVEVAFDKIGTKKLMLKAAGTHLTKL